MPNKICFKCQIEKDIILFYKHKEMADGHLNKCIECTKNDVLLRTQDPAAKERIVAYDKLRSKDPSRIAKCKIYVKRKRLNNPEYFANNRKEYRRLFPGKYKATNKVNNAIRDGRLVKQPCVICSTMEDLEAHHEDYRKYLDVIWFCATHHKAYHRGEVQLALLV